MKTTRAKWITGAAIVLGLAVCTLPVKKTINESIPAIQWQINDENTAKSQNIEIKGCYRNYLFRKDTFEGNFYIEGYDCTYTSDPLQITFNGSE